MPSEYTIGKDGAKIASLGGRIDIMLDDLYAAADTNALIDAKVETLRTGLKKVWELGKDQLIKVEGE